LIISSPGDQKHCCFNLSDPDNLPVSTFYFQQRFSLPLSKSSALFLQVSGIYHCIAQQQMPSLYGPYQQTLRQILFGKIVFPEYLLQIIIPDDAVQIPALYRKCIPTGNDLLERTDCQSKIDTIYPRF
jgi:hypothetical protein